MRGRVASGGHIVLLIALPSSVMPASAADLNIPAPPEQSGDKYPVAAPFGTGTSGFAEFSRGSTSLDFGAGDEKSTHWQLRGVSSMQIADGWNLQFDGGYRKTKAADASAHALSMAAHGYFRQDETYAVGAYMGIGLAGFPTLPQLAAFSINQDLKAFSGGIESAYFLSQRTIFARLGFGKIFMNGASMDQAEANAGIRHYVNDNLRLELEAGLRHWNAGHAEANILSLATAADYRLSDSPISAFGGYRFETLRGKDNGADVSGKTHGLLVGFRYHFGSKSLRDEERTGPLWSSPQDGF